MNPHSEVLQDLIKAADTHRKMAEAIEFREEPFTGNEKSSVVTLRSPGVIIKAQADNETVGKIDIAFDKGDAYVRGIEVVLQYRGQGLGQKLYDRAIAAAKKKGCSYFYSDTSPSRSKDAAKAWVRLRKRYEVEFVPDEDGYDSNGRNRIDLKTASQDPQQAAETKTASPKSLKSILRDNLALIKSAPEKWDFRTKSNQPIVIIRDAGEKNSYGLTAYATDGEYIGRVTFSRYRDQFNPRRFIWGANNFYVNKKWQRQGIGTKMYDIAEASGKRLRPSGQGCDQSGHGKLCPDGEAFWKSRGVDYED